MAWEETDKAIAELLRKLPQACFLILLASVTYLIIKHQHLFQTGQQQHLELQRLQPAQQEPPSPQPAATNEPNPSPPAPTSLLLPPPPPLKASDHHTDQKHHLLLAATGSVATIKLPQILHALAPHPNLSIRLILSTSAAQFLHGQSPEQPQLTTLLAHHPNLEAIYLDADEWRKPWIRGDPILHIELRRWADLMLVAPLSANALAKVAGGWSDGVVYAVARAWDTLGLIDGARPGVRVPGDGWGERTDVEVEGGDGRRRKKRIVVAPAMNTAMWNHPVTKKHLEVLEGEWNVANGGWVEVLRPIDKGLACGDIGGGAMREWKEIVQIVEERLGLSGNKDAKVEGEGGIEEHEASAAR